MCIPEAERAHWVQVKAKGRSRFILRNFVGSLGVWLGAVAVAQMAGGLRGKHDVRAIAIVAICLLLIAVLGAYLNANWKWKDLAAKFPD